MVFDLNHREMTYPCTEASKLHPTPQMFPWSLMQPQTLQSVESQHNLPILGKLRFWKVKSINGTAPYSTVFNDPSHELEQRKLLNVRIYLTLHFLGLCTLLGVTSTCLSFSSFYYYISMSNMQRFLNFLLLASSVLAQVPTSRFPTATTSIASQTSEAASATTSLDLSIEGMSKEPDP